MAPRWKSSPRPDEDPVHESPRGAQRFSAHLSRRCPRDGGRECDHRRALRCDRDHERRDRSAGVWHRGGSRARALMKIRFTKAHGAHNDFLLTCRGDVPETAGANAIIGARYDATEIMNGVTEVLAYGT